VILGIRPEDLSYQEKRSSSKSIKTTVDAIEVLGSEIHLRVNTGKHTMVTRVPPRRAFRVGDEAFFEADMGKTMFFDSKTENAISRSGL
jgi:ABC-type sugar transport system ATPase subunit